MLGSTAATTSSSLLLPSPSAAQKHELVADQRNHRATAHSPRVIRRHLDHAAAAEFDRILGLANDLARQQRLCADDPPAIPHVHRGLLYRKMRGPSHLPAPTLVSFKKNSNEGGRSEWLQLVNAHQAAQGCGHAEAVNALANTKEGRAAIQAERVQKLGRGEPAPAAIRKNSFTDPLPQTLPANAALRAAIEEHVAAHPELSWPQATSDLITNSPRGKKLYQAARDERLYGSPIVQSEA